MNISCYTTLAECKAQMDSFASTDDKKLMALIRQVSQRIDRMFYKRAEPFFLPAIATRNQFQLDGSRVNSAQGTFYIGAPILSLSGVMVGTQTVTPGTQVQLWQGEYGIYDTLQLVNSPCCHSWYSYINCAGCGRSPFVTIAGVWGYNTDYANAWLDTGQTVTNVAGMDASQATFTVTNVDADNTIGYAPALSEGNLIQIDSEWLYVAATDTATNIVTVKRGVNGSTAAAHAQGTVVYAYQVEESVRRATYKQAGKEYATIGVYDSQKTTGNASAGFTNDALEEFSDLLTLYAN